MTGPRLVRGLRCGCGARLLRDRRGQWCPACLAAALQEHTRCGAETFHTGTGLLGRCTQPHDHDGEHAVGGAW